MEKKVNHSITNKRRIHDTKSIKSRTRRKRFLYITLQRIHICTSTDDLNKPIHTFFSFFF